MLYRLEIENFYSIRLPQVLDLRVAGNVPDAPGRLDPLFPGSSERAARVIALFGANASGKSNVLKALAFLRWFAQSSFMHPPDATLPCERFNAEEAAEAPIRLAVEFGWPLDLAVEHIDGRTPFGTWRYELVMQQEAQPRRITVASEALRQKPEGKGKWVRVFERQGSEVRASGTFSLSGYSRVVDKVRDNASVISTLAQFDHKPSLALREAAGRILTNIFIDRTEFRDDNIAKFYAADSAALKRLNRDIQRIDLGIRQMDVISTAQGPLAIFVHEGLETPLPWILESHGTRSFIRYFPLIDGVLERGGIALVDEIDVAIHPIVLPEIVRWFHDPERNPHQAQLWMTCHAASLLEELLKEEIFFCEKDSSGRTGIFGLQNVQNVRRTDNRYRKYLSGVYGAIPRIG